MVQKYFKHWGPHGLHRVAYTEWGDPSGSRVLLAAHGAIRQGRDFDFLAAAFSDRWRVVSLDLPGRGESEWLTDPGDYTRALYLSVYATLIARLNVDQVDWIGSSMGGGLGLALAAQPETPLRHLILNDSGTIRGPLAGPAAGGTEGAPRFASLDEVEAYLRKTLASYGIQDPAVWRHFAIHSSRKTPEGDYRLHHDPAITRGAGSSPTAADPWALWDAIHIPVLLLRGVESRSLTEETAQEMTRRGPQADLIEFPGCGHFPSLTEPKQILLVRQWLESH